MRNKAIFLDRDWTINYDSWYVYRIENLEILNWAKEWLTNLKLLWYKLILLTNQSGIWRWYYTMEDCNKFNNELQNQLWIQFDWIYICPHTPEENCECRKPKTKLIEDAIKDFDLDIKQCYLIWDKDSDIQTGISVWCCTVLIKNDQYQCNLLSNYKVSSISEFSELLKQKY